MQKLTRILFFCTLLVQVKVFGQAAKKNFEFDSFDQARSESMNAEKPLVAFFTADWIMPCQWMEEHAFTETRVRQLLEASYTDVRIDIDGVSGKAVKKRFGVTKLPTILIFDARGTLKKTIEESVSGPVLADELQNFLLTYSSDLAANPVIDEDPGIPVPRPILEISRPAIIPEEVAVSTTLPQPGSAMFTIQVGVYADYHNALKARQQVNKFSNLDVSIVEHTQDGSLTYKVLAGSFTDAALAYKQLQQLLDNNIKGLVKPLY